MLCGLDVGFAPGVRTVYSVLDVLLVLGGYDQRIQSSATAWVITPG